MHTCVILLNAYMYVILLNTYMCDPVKHIHFVILLNAYLVIMLNDTLLNAYTCDSDTVILKMHTFV